MNSTEELTNIHILPRNLNEAHLKNAEESIQYMKDVRKDFSDEIVEFVVDQTISCIQQFGALNDGRRSKVQDLMMIENAIASAVYRYYNLEHPLQSITDDVFVIGAEEEDEEDEEDEESEEIDEIQTKPTEA